MNEVTGRLINEASGEVFELSDKSEIGRSHRAVVIVPDPRVSRKHAVIHRQADGFWFYDQGSVNGTYINGRRVTTAQRLVPGTILRIADHTFRFECSGHTGPRTEDTVSDPTIVDVQSVDAILLVSDIQGFTSLSERLEPDELAPLIGSWYERTEHILTGHHANLDKFLGDSVLAYWLETSNDVRRSAVRAAEAMQQACEDVSRQHHETLQREGLAFRCGAALHLGATAYGPIRPNDFTLLGDAVNVVFRLEKLTRNVEANVVASGDFFSGWEEGKGPFHPLGPHSVKGRDQAIEVFGLGSPASGE